MRAKISFQQLLTNRHKTVWINFIINAYSVTGEQLNRYRMDIISKNSKIDNVAFGV